MSVKAVSNSLRCRVVDGVGAEQEEHEGTKQCGEGHQVEAAPKIADRSWGAYAPRDHQEQADEEG